MSKPTTFYEFLLVSECGLYKFILFLARNNRKKEKNPLFPMGQAKQQEE